MRKGEENVGEKKGGGRKGGARASVSDVSSCPSSTRMSSDTVAPRSMTRSPSDSS